jgi:uroporphyrinogen decarboxylase
MNSLERLIASGKGEPLDCVPVAPGVGHYAAYQARQPMTRVAYDPELMAEVVLKALDRHGYDACSPITDYGIGTESMGSMPVIRDWEQTFVGEFAVKGRHDVVGLKLPDPLRDGRMPVIIQCEQILVERVGQTHGINGGLAGPLSFAANLRGPQQMLYDMLEDPALVHELVRLATEAGKAFGAAQIQQGGVKTVNIYEPLAALISPAMSDEFSFPYLTELVAYLKALGATVLLHICNDTTPLLERMIRSGADILSVDRQVDLTRAKQLARGRVSFSGNVATQHLAWRTPEVIYAEACRCIEQGALGGRYTVSSSCEVPIETPAENIDAMVRAAREFGAAFLTGQGSAWPTSGSGVPAPA